MSFVDGIHLYLPSAKEQHRRRFYLHRIHKKAMLFKKRTPEKRFLKREIKRLKDNIVEIKTIAYMAGIDRVYAKCKNILNSKVFEEIIGLVEDSPKEIINNLNDIFFNTLKPLVIEASSTSFITFDEIPEEIKRRYVSEDGKVFLVNIFTREDVWESIGKDGFLSQFKNIKNATGMPLLMQVLWERGKKETIKALLIVFAVILLILLIDFRSLKEAFIAYLPVLFAFIYTLGFLGLSGVGLNFLNVLALPLIIGIGIDDAVHIVHRYRMIGNVEEVFTRIGRAILYTSLTTMCAFGSLFVARYQGYPSFGIVVVIGVGVAFFVTITLLPGLLKIIKRR